MIPKANICSKIIITIALHYIDVNHFNAEVLLAWQRSEQTEVYYQGAYPTTKGSPTTFQHASQHIRAPKTIFSVIKYYFCLLVYLICIIK